MNSASHRPGAFDRDLHRETLDQLRDGVVRRDALPGCVRSFVVMAAGTWSSVAATQPLGRCR